MQVKFETITPTINGGANTFSVAVDVPDDATPDQVVELVEKACDTHYATTKAQQEWAEAKFPEVAEQMRKLRESQPTPPGPLQ
jgi:hypothetical protein